MAEKYTAAWTNAPTPRKTDVTAMTLDQLIETLDKKSTPQSATAFGEIKGLYTAYKLAPSNVLLEAIITKCLTIILNAKASEQPPDISTPVKSSRTHPESMDWEWLQGFEHFLLLNDISESSRQVYIRALKRVMKNYNIADVEALKRDIDWYISEYDGNDQASHNIHLSVLRQFKNYMHDERGYFFAIEENGEEEIVSRIYCTLDLAQEEFEGLVSDYCETADKIKMYDKFANPVKEYIAH